MREQQRLWEEIGASFDRTRQKPWTHVTRFLAAHPAGRLLDLMCGNGRHLPGAGETQRAVADGGRDAVGLDWSRTLCTAAQARAPASAVVQGDASRLPFQDASFDVALCVAGLPSVPDADARAAALRELLRVTRPGGVAQITVWWREAPRFAGHGAAGEPIDLEVPWKADGHDQSRTYHLYTVDELRATLVDAGWIVEGLEPVALAWAQPDNLVAVVHRPHANVE